LIQEFSRLWVGGVPPSPQGPAMAFRFQVRCFIVIAAGWELLRLTIAVVPRTLSSETEALALLRQKGAAAQCDPDSAGWLISQGWWDAARELVLLSHGQDDSQCRAKQETVVRKEVTDMKLAADGLLLALAPQSSAKVGLVRCAFQWAQNSTTIFLTVKFSHRWSSPGALKVHDEKATVSECCFNFTASGEHSQLKKSYTLNLGFFKEVQTKHWSWQHQSAGRLSVEIQKKEPARWTRLLDSKDKPSGMGVWDSMRTKWASELDDFDRAEAAEKRKAKAKLNAGKGTSEEDSVIEDEIQHEESENKCYDQKDSPFYRERDAKQLCEDYWPPTMKGARGTDTTWLVLFYSPKELKCRAREKTCTDVYQKWSSVMTKVKQLGGAKSGIVDCDFYKDWCKTQKVGHMPFVRRYKDGKRKAFYGDWDIDSIMSFVLAADEKKTKKSK